MAEFEVKVYRVVIEEHPNADALEIAQIEDYMSLVQKGVYHTGDLVVYLPEASVVPQDVIEELGLEGRLAGKTKNRVKAIKLRGVLSQGLVYPVSGKRFQGIFPDNSNLENPACLREDDDVQEVMGIEKYEPPVPVSLQGKVGNKMGYTLKYDIENIKKYKNVFHDGDDVHVTEKLHGTWCCLGYNVKIDEPIVTSKGLSAHGLVQKLDEEENQRNLYVSMWNKYGETVMRIQEVVGDSIYVLGEVFGPVQDLHYGEKDPVFAVFDIYVGQPGQGRYMYRDEVEGLVKDDFLQVPVVYEGPFERELLLGWTNGKTLWSDVNQIREGVVIRDANEGIDRKIGRRILKSVSEKYLLRKDGTEFN